MKTIIYYFSATGNNFSIAKKLKDQLGDTEIRSISKLSNETIDIDSEIVGFVFPIYAWGIPSIVKEFIISSNFKNVKYTFAIAGCGGIAGKSLVVLKKLLRSKDVNLNSGFIVSEPSNGINIDSSSAMHKFMKNNRGNRLHQSIDIRMNEITAIIKSRKNHNLEKDALVVNETSNLINKLASRVFKSQDKNFWTTDNCTGCGTCKNICPRDNITMQSNKPVWNHNCEYCTACIHWCPVEAIEFGDVTSGKPRYHKKDIDISELL